MPDSLRTDVFAYLLSQGAKLDDRDEEGMTAVMWAAWLNKNPEMITTLLKAGADGRAKDTEGRTAFDYAKKNGKLKGTPAYWVLNNARF